MKIISGGQSGVDRAALDFALKNHIPCGGWCPKGRLAEDGKIDPKYPLFETQSSMYSVRTRMNVDDSDGTLILYTGVISNGTSLTANYAMKQEKPLLLVNISISGGSVSILNWIEKYEIKVLNIAGPRESTSPGIYQMTVEFLANNFA